MSLLIKKLLKKLKVEEINVQELLQNNWSVNGENTIFKINNIVFVNLSLRRGTSAGVLTLPDEFRPKENLMRQLSGNLNEIGYAFVKNTGELEFQYIDFPVNFDETFMTSFTFKV